jgi:hypothetical protein
MSSKHGSQFTYISVEKWHLMEANDELHAPGKYFVVPTGQEADFVAYLTFVMWKTFLYLPGIEDGYPGHSARCLVSVLLPELS